jgi:gas vesicle protein
MELFVFVLGILIGGLIHLGTTKLFSFKKSTSKDDVYERTLKEWQANFEDLESKQTDLGLQLEQIRDILKNSSFNDLLKAKDRLDTLVEEFKLEKQSNKETSNRMFSDLYLLKENMKYIPKDENIY